MRAVLVGATGNDGRDDGGGRWLSDCDTATLVSRLSCTVCSVQCTVYSVQYAVLILWYVRCVACSISWLGVVEVYSIVYSACMCILTIGPCKYVSLTLTRATTRSMDG